MSQIIPQENDKDMEINIFISGSTTKIRMSGSIFVTMDGKKLGHDEHDYDDDRNYNHDDENNFLES